MPYDILLGKSALKTYSKLSLKLRLGVDRCLSFLEVSPKHGPNIQRLKGKQGVYRFQVGGWRILYMVDEEQKHVRVYAIGPRGDVYKH